MSKKHLAPNYKIALLIDCENVASVYLQKCVTELTKFGSILIKRAYADWSLEQSCAWRDLIIKKDILPVQQFNYRRGKNSADGALIIDAMEILYNCQFINCFAIFSNDSDFNRLAMKLREKDKFVIGIGYENTGSGFFRFCNDSISIKTKKSMLNEQISQDLHEGKKQKKSNKKKKH